MSCINDQAVKKHIFVKNSKINIWSTFRQHLLPKCCLKSVIMSKKWKKKWVFLVMFKATFRQHMLPKCWPNVDFWNFLRKYMFFHYLIVCIAIKLADIQSCEVIEKHANFCSPYPFWKDFWKNRHFWKIRRFHQEP